jgi:hypothetical protein
LVIPEKRCYVECRPRYKRGTYCAVYYVRLCCS